MKIKALASFIRIILSIPLFFFLFGSGVVHAQSINPNPAKTDPQGTSYSSQKLVFNDPLTRHVVWRMTVDGTQKGALNTLRDSSGMEANSWSPDSKKICYAKTGHSQKPDGLYIMDVLSGVETLIVRTKPGPRWGTCEFSKTTNELFYTYGATASTIQQSYMEILAVNLTTLVTRTIKRFYNALGYSVGLSQNKDGSLIATLVSVNTPGEPVDTNQVHVVILNTRGDMLPGWTFNPSDPPDITGAGDQPYWSPADSRILRAHRGGLLHMWNIDTFAVLPNPTIVGRSTLVGSHGCFTADGKTYLQMSSPHPDCHPTEVGLGDRTHVTYDVTPYLYLSEMRNAPSVRPPQDILVVRYMTSNPNNFAHPHPHFSRDGKYILFVSPMNSSAQGVPPGGLDADTSTVNTDIFIVPLVSPTPNPIAEPKNVSVQ